MNNRPGGVPPPPPPSHVFKRGRPGDDGPSVSVRPMLDPRFSGGRGGDNSAGRDNGRGFGGRFSGRGRGPPPMGRGPPMIYGRERAPSWSMGRAMFPPEGGHMNFGRAGPHVNMGRVEPRNYQRGDNFSSHQRPPPPPPHDGDTSFGRILGPPAMLNHHERMGTHGGMIPHHGVQFMPQLHQTMYHPHQMPHMGAPQMHQAHTHVPQSVPQDLYLQHQGLQREQDQFFRQQPFSAPTDRHAQVAPGQPQPTSYGKEQIDGAWTEHTAPNSMKYYHNSILQESTYIMPLALAGTLQQPSVARESDQAAAQRTWIEYSDPTSGKKYYSNGITTTWEKPDGFDVASGNAPPVESRDEGEPPIKRKKESKKEIKFSSKEEALAAFKGLLLGKGITPIHKWNDVFKICSLDSRWESFEILSLGERKQALAEYQTKRSSELKNRDREERKRAKDAFVDLLSEMLPTFTNFNVLTSRLRDVRDVLSKDDRFHAVEEESTRESLFLEFCEESRKRDERKKRNRKREVRESFFAALKEHEDSGKLTFASTWSSFLSSLDEGELNDPRLQPSSLMSDSDRELYFSDYVIEVQVAEDAKRRRIREARKRAETAQREAFCTTLRSLAVDGKIVPGNRWAKIEALVHTQPSFAAVHEQGRHVPRDLFDDFISEWENRYKRDKSFMSRMLLLSKETGLESKTFTAESTYDDFKEYLLACSSGVALDYQDSRHIINTEDPVSNAKVYFNELAKGKSESPTRHYSKLGTAVDDSSVDEGEIVEDGEIED